jgi:protein SCO1/2
MNRPHPTTRRRVLGALGAGAALALLGTGCERVKALASGSTPAFHATDITGASFARELALPDADGRARTLADWKGKAVVVFFGYTQCPDVCPTTLTEMVRVRQLLGPESPRLETVFVTIDPERDTPEILKAYVGSFGPGFTALRGSPEQTAAAAKEFKVLYAKVPGKTPGSYTMDHSAAAFVFDPQGRVRLYVPYGSDPEKLAGDLRQLLA